MSRRTPRNKSHMAYSFATVPSANAPRSKFKTDRTYKTDFDAGFLIPFFVDEILPGDTLQLNATLIARLMTPIVPVMDNIYIDTHFFFVPNRLVWDNWEKFNGAQDNPGDSTDFLIPQMTPEPPATGWTIGSLADYFGIPTNIGTSPSVNSLPFRAYNLIWNDWYRDQNLQDSLPVATDDGPDTAGDYIVRRRNKRHDYITSCLPFPQKGDDVLLPLGETAEIILNPDGAPYNQQRLYKIDGTNPTAAANLDVGSSYEMEAGTADVVTDPSGNWFADLSTATSANINALRFAFQYQKKLERDARSGTRYTEYLLAHWNVTSPDARLQRPEYLGGGTQRVGFETVPNTNLDTNDADLSAYALTVGDRNGFIKSFVEHGHVIGLISARVDLTYQQGLPRMFSRQTVNDFYLPVFAHLGEQAVLNKEIYTQGNSADDETFGYQERWAEYKYGISKITGNMRSTAITSLDVWHLSQEFGSLPTLSSDFIQEDPPIDRISAVQDEKHFKLDAYIQANHTRIMPVYSVPGMIDHF